MVRSIKDPMPKPLREKVVISVVIAVPFVAIVVALPVAWRWGLTWDVVALAIALYVISMLGVSAGFHRLFTHRSFRAARPLRIFLAIAGSFAVEGPILRWVADHRRHHAFSDREGDPHSPWRYGSNIGGLLRGLLHAHFGWFYDSEETNQETFVPDLLRDRDIRIISRLAAPLAALGFILPGAVTYAAGGSIGHALNALFWAGLVRVFLVHHVSWSVNSICHTVGNRPFPTRDKSANFWPLALLSMGDSWHNAHHAMPTCARHGVLPGQVDLSASFISLMERVGWATAVKWPPRDLPAHRSTHARTSS